MACCDEIRHAFFSELQTVVPYDGRFGSTPTVDIFYKDADGAFVIQGAGIFTQVELTPGAVVVTHGDIATGIIKIH